MKQKLQPTPVLEGRSLRLRKVRPWDAWSLYKNLHAPEVRQFESAGFVGSQTPGEEGFGHRFRHLGYLIHRGLCAIGFPFVSGKTLAGYRLAVVPKDVGWAVGIVDLTEIDVARQCADIGILLGKDYWGRGLMIETESLLLAWAFDELQLTRVYANVNSENVASYITMKKLGFQRDSVLCQMTDARGHAVEMIRVAVTPETFRRL